MKAFLVLAAFFTLSLNGVQALASESEKIMGVTYDESGITYQVMSSGCTSKDHFEILQSKSQPVSLELRRIEFDFCEAFLPYGTKINFTWGELGFISAMPFIISNQLAPGQFRSL